MEPGADSSQLKVLRGAAEPSAAGRLLRLSVTNRCNFACLYCVDSRCSRRDAAQLSSKNLLRHAAWAIRVSGADRVKLTGGEPLLCRDLEHMAESLRSISQVREISLTTNGSLLASRAASLLRAGVSRVNISLDTLDEKRFAELTRGARLRDALRGVDAALRAGLHVKLNAVLLRSNWREELTRLFDYASERGLTLRLIELMNAGGESSWASREYLPAPEAQRWLQGLCGAARMQDADGAPSRRSAHLWRGAMLQLGWIEARSHPFCGSCQRLRMDAQAHLHRCLMDPVSFDLPQALRLGEEAAASSFRKYWDGKRPPMQMRREASMMAIGG